MQQLSTYIFSGFQIYKTFPCQGGAVEIFKENTTDYLAQKQNDIIKNGVKRFRLKSIIKKLLHARKKKLKIVQHLKKR